MRLSSPEPTRAPRRALGYRLLGGSFDYLLHLRPAEWPIMAAHTALGMILAVGWSGIPQPDLSPLLLGLTLWVVCLNGGTLAINSAFDRDTEDVAYLRAPPAPPRYLFVFGLSLMAVGLAGAMLLPAGYLAAYALCLVLSVLYSVPPVRLKAVAGADWFINLWGFGALTPYAGWAATGRPVTPAGVAILMGFGALFASFYPLTQLYQLEADRARGDRTLATVLGVERSLDLALGCGIVAFALFGLGGLRAGWLDLAVPLRWGGLAAAAAVWLGGLLWWRMEGARLSAPAHQRRMYLALAAWAAVDLAILVGFA